MNNSAKFHVKQYTLETLMRATKLNFKMAHNFPTLHQKLKTHCSMKPKAATTIA